MSKKKPNFKKVFFFFLPTTLDLPTIWITWDFLLPNNYFITDTLFTRVFGGVGAVLEVDLRNNAQICSIFSSIVTADDFSE